MKLPPLAAGLPDIGGNTVAFPVELELRIDGNEELLVPVTYMAVSRQGTIAITQRQLNAVRLFSAAGDPIGSIGRSGDGPGEFELVERIGWIGDTLWVVDRQQRRVTLVSREATLIGTFTYRPAQPDTGLAYAMAAPVAVYPDSSIMIWTVRGSGWRLHVSPDGVIEWKVLRPLSDSEGAVSFQGREGGFGSMPVPLYPQPHVAVARDGSRIASVSMAFDSEGGGSFRVTVANAWGDTIFSRDYSYTGIPVPDSIMDRVMANLDLENQSMLRRYADDPGEILDELRDRVPDVLPPIIDIFIGMDDRVWLALYPTEMTRPWIILDGKDGHIEGMLKVPGNVVIAAANATDAWGTMVGEYDVESVVRYRIRQPAGPSPRE